MATNSTDGKGTSVSFDIRVFSVSAIKKAAYRYLDSFAIDINLHENDIHCSLHFSSSLSAEKRNALTDDFKKEVLDQDLRERLKLETEPVRNLILAHTFSKTGIVSDGQVSED